MSTTESASDHDPQGTPVGDGNDTPTLMTSTSAAGWYPDPDRSGQLRFFDGDRWTEQRTTYTQPPAPVVVPMPQGPRSLGPVPPVYEPMPYPYPYPYPVSPVVAPKNPAVSLLISFFIPGVGSMVNGDAGIGIAILMGYCVSLVLTLVLIGFLTAPAFWIWGLVDAYTGAQRWNGRHGIIS